MAEILVFGGAFDPITTAHIHAAERVCGEFKAVWFTPCQSSRYGKNMTHEDHRIDMIHAALNDWGNKKFRVCEAEFFINAQGKMYDLACYLKGNDPQTNYTYLIGTDTANNIKSWYEWKRLTDEFNFVIVSRNGEVLQTDVFDDPRHWHCELDLPAQISSTLVRNQFRKMGSSEFVTPQTFNYIKEHGLYGASR